MTVIEKLEFLAKSYGLSEHKFLARFHTHFGLMKKLRNGHEANPNDVKKLCKELNFDVEDFLDSKSTVSSEIKDGEHMIKMAKIEVIPAGVAPEDYPHEDNGRYEEKD